MILELAPEVLVECGHCCGEGVICKTVHVYEAGCGFSHPDEVAETCPHCDGRPLSIVPAAGEKVVTDYWRKPGPTDQFDWSAYFDNDEPSDNGGMMVGYGATEVAAVEDLLRLAEEAESCRVEVRR